MKKSFSWAFALIGMAAFADPQIENVRVSSAGGIVTVTYGLSSAPAVVTMDVQTNGVSIGGEHIRTFEVGSDVMRKVSGKETYEIRWRADLDWAGNRSAANGAKVVLTAWPLNNTPDYLVLDISAGAKPGSERYYPAVEFLPGGLLENDAYRQIALVMRKVMARNVTWKMGSVSEAGRNASLETQHVVTLGHNYYLAVFETTQAQSELLGYTAPRYGREKARSMRPEDRVCFNYLFSGKTAAADTSDYYPPKPPKTTSPMGVLKTRTGFDFSLPSEAEWEYACRAGHGEFEWGNGAAMYRVNTGNDPNMPGRSRGNGGTWFNPSDNSFNAYPADCDVTNGTAVVGSYDPNSWGFYDMHGNVQEWCRDWYEVDITGLGGADNINADDPSKLSSGGTSDYRIQRGGTSGFGVAQCRSASRGGEKPTKVYSDFNASYLCGYRLYTRAGLD